VIDKGLNIDFAFTEHESLANFEYLSFTVVLLEVPVLEEHICKSVVGHELRVPPMFRCICLVSFC